MAHLALKALRKRSGLPNDAIRKQWKKPND
jgi:hypothetical protein